MYRTNNHNYASLNSSDLDMVAFREYRDFLSRESPYLRFYKGKQIVQMETPRSTAVAVEMNTIKNLYL